MTTVEPGASEVFTQGFDVEAALDRLLREQAGADHHRRVRGVRAARDRGDHDPAVVEVELVAVRVGDRRRSRCSSPRRDRGLRVAGGGGLSLRCSSAVSLRSSPGGSEAGNVSLTVSSWPFSASAASLVVGAEHLEERALGVGQRDPVLRALRAGDRGLDVAEVELERLGEGRVLGVARRGRSPARACRRRRARSSRSGGR